MANGTVAGTGAAINVSLGFKPSFVKVWNPNDAGALAPKVEWTSDMAAASAFKTLKTVDNATTGNSSSQKLTTLGISPYAGDINNPPGFTIGADADVNVSGETICWYATR